MTWKEFKTRVGPLLPTTVKFHASDKNGASRVLFRGHADSKWGLKTTLERAVTGDIQLPNYLSTCTSARRFIGNHLPSEIAFDESPQCGYEPASRRLPNYEYLGFLRHHGFPSPLLDWSESPYVAAFFAFRNIRPEVDKVRIYIYRSHVSWGKSFSATDPCLFVQGPFASIHERHAMQQCWYTVCLKSDGNNNCVLSSHEEALKYVRTKSFAMQDLVEECDFPVSERDEVLADLFAMNITPYTLFRSVDALVETAAWRTL